MAHGQQVLPPLPRVSRGLLSYELDVLPTMCLRSSAAMRIADTTRDLEEVEIMRGLPKTSRAPRRPPSSSVPHRSPLLQAPLQARDAHVRGDVCGGGEDHREGEHRRQVLHAEKGLGHVRQHRRRRPPQGRRPRAGRALWRARLHGLEAAGRGRRRQRGLRVHHHVRERLQGAPRRDARRRRAPRVSVSFFCFFSGRGARGARRCSTGSTL